MKQKIQIAVLVLIVTLSFCNKKEPEINQVVQEVIEINEEKQAGVEFSFIDKVKVTEVLYPTLTISENRDRIFISGVYLNDQYKKIIKIFNGKLKYISQKIFHVGQGPGDMSASNVLTPVGEKLFISGNSNSRVDVYNENFEYIKSIRYSWERVGGPFPLMDNGRCFIGTRYAMVGKKFNITYKMVSFPGMDEKVILEKSMIHPMLNGGIFPIDTKPHSSYFFHDKYIYFLYMNDYQLLKFAVNGNRLKDVIVKTGEIRISEAEKKRYLKEYVRCNEGRLRKTFSDTVMPAGSLVSLAKGFVVVRRKNYSKECAGMVEGDYFNYGIDFVGKVKIPCFYRIYSLLGTKFIRDCQYDNGFIYTAHEIDEVLWLEKWQVVENENEAR